MKANSKKLLSLLVVVALVVAMAPAISLQADAAEFDATNTICEACGTAPAGGWTEIPAGSAAVTLTESGHYYLSGSLSGTSGTSASAGMLNIAAGATVCLHSNGQQIKNNRTNTSSNNPKSAAIRVAGTLNYFGTGTVVNRSESTSYPSVVIASGGSANIYGGTFSYFDPTNCVADGYAATNNGDGTWTVAEAPEEPTLNLPSTCPGCGDTVTEWVPVDAATGANDWNKGSGHFYLTKDLTGGGKRVMQFIAGDEVCLHLNGHSITSTCATDNSITVRSYGTLRIMGEGTISAGANTAAMGAVVAYGGTVEIYGGTYVDNTANLPVRVSGGAIEVYGGTFCDNPSSFVQDGYEATENQDGTWTVAEVTAPTVTADCPHCDEENIEWLPFTGGMIGVDGDTNYNHYYLPEKIESEAAYVIQNNNNGANAVLYLNGQDVEFTGRIRTRSAGNMYIFGEGNVTRLNNTEAANAMIQAASGYIYISGGNYTNNDADGTMFEGDKLVITGGTFSEDPSNFVPADYQVTKSGNVWTVTERVAEPLPTTCPMCGEENVTWTEVTAATGDAGFAASGHYALAGHIVGGAKRAFRVLEGTEVCLHLNGYNITTTSETPGPIALQSYGILRVMGKGEVSSQGTNTQWAPIVADNGGTVEIYGGTYVTDVEGRKALTMQEDEGNTMIVYGGTFSSDPSKYLADGLWALPAGDIWTAESMKAAAIIKDTSYKTYDSTAAAMAEYTEGYILIGTADAIELTKDAYVDNNGKAIVVTGSGKLYAMDSVGNGAWTVAAEKVVRDVTNPVTEERFLTVGNESYEIDLKMTQVVLRAGQTSDNMGLYYKAAITTSDELAGKVEAYGAVFSLLDAPDAGFINDADSRYTMMDGPVTLNDKTAVMNSGAIFGIMDENTSDKNAEYGEMKIYASAYIALDLDGDGNEEYIMASNGARHSLKDVLVAINAMETIPAVVKNFYNYWAQYGMDAWAADLGNIAAA